MLGCVPWMQAQGLHKEGEAAGTGRYQKVSREGRGRQSSSSQLPAHLLPPLLEAPLWDGIFHLKSELEWES